MLSIIEIGISVMLREIGIDFYIGGSGYFIDVREKNIRLYIFWGLLAIVYDYVTINNI
jgi:hypothetical protein